MLIFAHMTDYVNNNKFINAGILEILKIIDITKAYRHDKLSLRIHLSRICLPSPHVTEKRGHTW